MRTVQILFLIVGITSTTAQGANMMRLIDEIALNLHVMISPTSDDDEYLLKFDKLTYCVTKAASEDWTEEKLLEFGSLLKEHAEKVEEIMSDMNKLIKKGIPKPPKKLINDLKILSATIEHCESEYGIRVEF
ncbi:hypothetical protein A6F57_16370 [Alteromonas stellipolaris]|jgi:hypothetical protein|uniref:hypothetical protein n=1 Tax=Alteromonas TaxID=226 RepID=UPI0007B42A25|nr:hypothetical protein [Alteromonas stellipolaris]ANB26621.1 hypothetical protein A6F57_16370 [Alteromonas stellipolaris]